MGNVNVIFDSNTNAQKTNGWQAVIPLQDLMGIDDGDTACLILKDGHLINLPDGDVYEVAKVVWRPWGFSAAVGANELGWAFQPHLLVMLHRVGSNLGERVAAGADERFLRALAEGHL